MDDEFPSIKVRKFRLAKWWCCLDIIVLSHFIAISMRGERKEIATTKFIESSRPMCWPRSNNIFSPQQEKKKTLLLALRIPISFRAVAGVNLVSCNLTRCYWASFQQLLLKMSANPLMTPSGHVRWHVIQKKKRYGSVSF